VLRSVRLLPCSVRVSPCRVLGCCVLGCRVLGCRLRSSLVRDSVERPLLAGSAFFCFSVRFSRLVSVDLEEDERPRSRD
jgi:hypothetical protein